MGVAEESSEQNGHFLSLFISLGLQIHIVIDTWPSTIVMIDGQQNNKAIRAHSRQDETWNIEKSEQE